MKIDRSFVNGVTTESQDASIVSAVIGMGERLSLRVVAEGIETREQLAFLQEQRCPFGQGYYFSRPVSAADFSRIAAVGGVADVLFVEHDSLAAGGS